MRRSGAALTEAPREGPPTPAMPLRDGPRPLQRMGSVTVGVSLPREWVEARGLGVGSPVFLTPLADGSILVRDRTPAERPLIARIPVRVDRPREHLFRSLVAAYLDGAQEFVVTEPGGLSAETRAIVRTFIRRTIHPEIVTEDDRSLYLRDVSRGADFEYAPLLRRLHQLAQRLQEEAGAVIEEGTRRAADDWARLDDEVDRHAWLIERILTMRSGSAPPRREAMPAGPAQILLVVRSLERVADHAVLIAHHGSRWAESSPPATSVRAVVGFHAEARRLLADSFAAAEGRDADASNDLLDTGEALHEQYQTLVGEALPHRDGRIPPHAGGVAHALLLQSIDRTVAYAQDIAEAGLDAGIQSRIRLELEASPAGATGPRRRPEASGGPAARRTRGAGAPATFAAAAGTTPPVSPRSRPPSRRRLDPSVGTRRADLPAFRPLPAPDGPDLRQREEFLARRSRATANNQP